MADSNSCITPMATSTKLGKEDNEMFDQPTHNRSIIGGLQYLTLSKLDLAFAVNKLSHFLQSPTMDHWTDCKRVLRYVKGTLQHEFFLQNRSIFLLKLMLMLIGLMMWTIEDPLVFILVVTWYNRVQGSRRWFLYHPQKQNIGLWVKLPLNWYGYNTCFKNLALKSMTLLWSGEIIWVLEPYLQFLFSILELSI